MELDIREEVDFAIFLGDHDRAEIDFLLNNLENKHVFLDIGSNIGYYSLLLKQRIAEGRIISIEADKYNFERLIRHVKLNSLNIECYNLAISDISGKAFFKINTNGNRGGSGIVTSNDGSDMVKEVDCLTLSDFISRNNIDRIDGMKIDIEGYEYPVLKHFFSNAPTRLWPKIIVIEAFGHSIKEVNGSPVELLIRNNYTLVDHTLFNFFFKRLD
jgi:FkbM family methyltransferase